MQKRLSRYSKDKRNNSYNPEPSNVRLIMDEQESELEQDSVFSGDTSNQLSTDKQILGILGLMGRNSQSQSNHVGSSQLDEDYKTQFDRSNDETNKMVFPIIKVEEVDEIEQLRRLDTATHLEELCKQLLMFCKRISVCCRQLYQHPWFQGITLLVIIANTLSMSFADTDSQNQTPLEDALQKIFISFYLLEMVLKVIGMGFMFNQGAYLRNGWNVIDFVIVGVGLVSLFSTQNLSVSALRAIRVLRPLRTITKVPSLRMMVKTLFASFRLVFNAILLLGLTLVVYGVLGRQLYSTISDNICFNTQTGLYDTTKCTESLQCQALLGETYLCHQQFSRTQSNLFESLWWSMVTILQILTMEGWSQIVLNLQFYEGFTAFVFGISIIIICSFLLFNITLAILKYQYSLERSRGDTGVVAKENKMSIQMLKRLGIYQKITKVKSDNVDNLRYGTVNEFKRETLRTKTTKHRDDLRNSKNIFYGKQKQTKISKASTFKKIPSGETPEVPVFGSCRLPTTKSIEIYAIKCSQDYIVSEPRLVKEEFPLNQVIYQAQWELQQLTDLSLQSMSSQSEGQIQLNVREINKTERNKYILSLEKDNFRDDDVLRVLSQLQQVKIQQQLLQKTTLNNVKESVTVALAGNKNTKLIQNQLNERVQMQAYKKAKQELEIFKKEQELAIQDIKMLNDLKHKELTIELVKLGELSDKWKLSIESILSKKTKRAISKTEQHTTQAKIIYRSKHEEKERHRLEDKEIRIPSRSETFNISEMKSTKMLSFHKTNIQTERNLQPTFKIRFNNLSPSWRQPTYIDKTYSIDHLDKKCFSRSMTEFTRGKKTNKISQLMDIPYEDLLKEDASCEEQYGKLAKLLNRNEEIMEMGSPADDILRTSVNTMETGNVPTEEEYNIWIDGSFGLFKIFRNRVRVLLLSNFYDGLVLTLVVGNTVILSLNGLVSAESQASDYLATINSLMTVFFSIDLILKMLAYDMEFFQDFFNVFDMVVVIVSFVELNQQGTTNFSAFKSFRVLRALRALRVVRLIRSLRFMTVIASVIVNIIIEFAYIFILLALFVLIYVLLGMQIFGGGCVTSEFSGIRQNFNSFFESLVTVVQVLTVQNWNDIQNMLLQSSNTFLVLIYLISWILIGNWMLLNLLQAVLLDGFDIEDVRVSLQDRQQSQNEVTSINLHSASTSFPTTKNIQFSRSNKQIGQRVNNDSLFLFSVKNKFRKLCTRITQHRYFEIYVIASILMSGCKLVYDTYTADSSYSTIIDYIINTMFILEFVFKIVADGLFWGNRPFLNDNWNKLDFLIIILNIVDFFVEANLQATKILRILRPLRMIAQHSRTKIIIQSLGESIAGLANISLLVFLVMLVFSILCINLLQGKLNYCDMDKGYTTSGPYNMNQSQCLSAGHKWKTREINFDNIYRAMLSLYIFSTKENWPAYYYSFVDADDNGPVANNSPYLFFAVCACIIFFISYFMMNLLVGVLFINFRLAQQKYSPQILTEKQEHWAKLQQLIFDSTKNFSRYVKPQNCVRKIVKYYSMQMFLAITHPYYGYFNSFMNVLSVFSFGYAADPGNHLQLAIANTIKDMVKTILLTEVLVKMLGYSIKGYLWDMKSCIEFLTAIWIILEWTTQLKVFAFLMLLFSIIKCFFVIRNLEKFTLLQRLIDAILAAIPSLGHVLMILGLYLFICAILGCSIFGQVVYDPYGVFDGDHNFTNFHKSLQILFVCLTGQNWYLYMFACMSPETRCLNQQGQIENCGTSLAILFWLPFMLIGQHIILELFVLVVLNQFQKSYIQENNPLSTYKHIYQDFTKNWVEACRVDPSRSTITTNELVKLCLKLKPPLGLGQDKTIENLKQELFSDESEESQATHTKQIYSFICKQRQSALKLIRNLELPQGNLSYHYVFYKLARFSYGEYDSELTEEQRRIMTEIEANNENKFLLKERDRGRKSTKVDAVMDLMFVQIVLNSWSRYTQLKENQDTRNIYKSQMLGGTSDLEDSLSIISEQVGSIPIIHLNKTSQQPLKVPRKSSLKMARLSHLQTFRPREHFVPDTDNSDKMRISIH